MRKVSLINWNIGNSSFERFSKQFTYILQLNPDVIVFTEVGNCEKADNIKAYVENYNYRSYTNSCYSDKYAVAILIRENYKATILCSEISDSRNIALTIDIDRLCITIVGTYFPSNNRKLMEKKKAHHEKFLNLLDSIHNQNVIILGDFNSVRQNHIPRFSWFRNWEYEIFNDIEKRKFVDASSKLNKPYYSWYGNTGLGHLYDYCFLTEALSNHLLKCVYVCDVINEKLSDHALQNIEIKLKENEHD